MGPMQPPPASSESTRRVMQANRSKDTKPELQVRKALRDAGFPGYRLHWKVRGVDGKLVGRPDVCYPGRKVAIFVHGCFWHRCPHCQPVLPKSNREFWEEKIERNMARDSLNRRELQFDGWTVLTIRECKIDEGVEDALVTLSAELYRFG